jgi:hypothetical protein
MTSTLGTGSTRIARFVTTATCATGITIGAMTMAAPAANAIAEKDIKSECSQAGGSYGTGMTPAPDNHRVSWCDNAAGEKIRDYYVDGAYVATVSIPRNRTLPNVVPRAVADLTAIR